MSEYDNDIITGAPAYITPFWSWTAFTPTIPKLYWDVRSQEQRILNLCKLLDRVINYVDYVASTYNQNADDIIKLDKRITALAAAIRSEIAAVQGNLDKATEELTKYTDAAKADAEKYADETQAKAQAYTDERLKSYVLAAVFWDESARISALIGGLQTQFDKLAEIVNELQKSNRQWDVQHGYFTDTVTAQRDMFNDLTVHALTVAELAELNITVAGLADSGLNVRGLAVMSWWLVDKFDLPNGFRYFDDPTTSSNVLNPVGLEKARINQNGFVYVSDKVSDDD